jgi:hypothetical protein
MKDQDQRSEDRTSLAISNQNENTSNQTTDFVDNSPEAQQAKQLQNMADNSAESLGMQEWESNVEQSKENTTGLPDDLKTNLEAMSGMSLDQVKVHYNSSKPAKLDAYAYAEFPNIYIAPGQEKHLPEEAAHMVQQMQGRVKPTNEVNGMPINDNASLEKEAVKEGQKASGGVQKNKGKDLVQKKGKGVVQRAKIEKKSHHGTFSVDDAKYDFIDNDKKLDLDLTFEPTENADATKVGLAQVIKYQKNGKKNFLDPNIATKGTSNGSFVDQLSHNRNPLYATGEAVPAKDDDKLETYSTPDGKHAIKDPIKGWSNANITDKPTTGGGGNSMKEFETSALVLEGNDKGEYYGSVKWGWEKDGAGILKKIDFDLVSKGAPSKNFMEAAEKWNDGKARGTLVVKNDNTDAVSNTLAQLFKLQKGDEVTQVATLGTNTQNYISFKVKTSPKNPSLVGKKGIMKVEELEDKGDGKDTVDLPLMKTKVPIEGDISLYKDKEKTTEDKKIGVKTRMKVLKEQGEMVEIEIVDGDKITNTGWVEKSKLKDE